MQRFDLAVFGGTFSERSRSTLAFRSLVRSLLLEIVPQSHDGLGPEAEVTEGLRSTVDGHKESVGPRGLNQTETSTESISAPRRGREAPGGTLSGVSRPRAELGRGRTPTGNCDTVPFRAENCESHRTCAGASRGRAWGLVCWWGGEGSKGRCDSTPGADDPQVTVTRAPARPRVSFSPEAREVGVTAARLSHSSW